MIVKHKIAYQEIIRFFRVQNPHSAETKCSRTIQACCKAQFLVELKQPKEEEINTKEPSNILEIDHLASFILLSNCRQGAVYISINKT